MSEQKRSTTLRITTALAVAAGVAAAVLLLRGAPAQAQAQPPGPMSAPACQCSAPVSINGMSSRVAHCMCGAMSCAITESGDVARHAPVMQCVRQ